MLSRLVLLVLLCTSPVLGSVDSLLQRISGLDDAEKIVELNNFTWKYRRNNPEDAVKAGNLALSLSRKIGNKSLEARALNQLGIVHRSLVNSDSSLHILQEALTVATAAKNEEEIAYALNNIGGSLLMKAYYTRAFQYIVQSLRKFESLHDTVGMSYALVNIAFIYQGQKNQIKAKEYFEKVYALRMSVHDTIGALSITDDLANVKLHEGNVKEAEAMLLHAEREYAKLHDPSGHAFRLLELGRLYIKLGDIGKAYNYLVKAHKLAQSTGHKLNLIHTSAQLGLVKVKLGQFAEGELLVLSALKMAEPTKDFYLIANICEIASNAYASVGKYSEAYSYSNRYSALRDSITARDNISSVSEMEALYQNEKAKRENAVLQKSIENTENQRTFFVVFALFFIAISGVLAWRNFAVRRALAAEERSRRSEAKFNSAFDINPDAICITSLSTHKYTAVNKSFQQITGYSKTEVLGKTSQELMIWDNDADRVRIGNELIIKGKVENIQARFRIKGGDIRIGLLSATIIEDGNDKLVFNVIRDITDWVSAQEDIAMLYRAIEQSPISIMILDLHGRIEYANTIAITTTNLISGQAIGKPIDMVLPELLEKQSIDTLLASVLTQAEWKSEYSTADDKSNKQWWYATISPIKDSSATVNHFLLVIENVTERKKLEEGLTTAKEKAETANKLKDAFIANISHEIRTPLNGIIGMTSIIESIFSARATNEQLQYFNAVEISSKRLMSTIDMILNFSRLQVGEYPTHRTLFSLSALAERISSEYIAIAGKKGLCLSLNKAAGNDIIFADESSIIRALGNIVDNAIKFSDHGSVVISVYSSSVNTICMDIADEGIGISEEYMEHLFEPYTQEYTGFNRPYEGVGLGLSISKSLLYLNNATIAVKTSKQEGTVFTVCFEAASGMLTQPVRKVTIAEHERNQDPGAKQQSILIVEDDPVNQLYFSKLLERNGLLTIASNATSALMYCRSNLYDLILIDISLGEGLNGLELLKLIREGQDNADVPIVVVTGHAFPDDRKKAFDAGCSDFLTKPFTESDFLKVVSPFLKQHE